MSLVREISGVKYYRYDIDKFPFVKLVQDCFNTADLSKIHELIEEDAGKVLFTNENDDQTLLHQIFYGKLRESWPEFDKTYRNFIKDFIGKIYDTEEIIFQTSPTFRVQIPNNIAVGGNNHDTEEQYGWHKDSDPEYNHPLNENNFIIPLTNSRETASVYIEDSPNSESFTSALMNVGETFNFDGGRCKHGNKRNTTGLSRVSLDFRVVLPEDYNEDYSKNSKISTKKFIVGEYYDRI